MASAPGFEKHPEHRIDTAIVANHVRVSFNGEQIADTRQALQMNEGKYPPVFYVPRDDVDMAHLQATDHESYCPFKGQARYWSVNAGGKQAENAVWGYDDPYDELLVLKDYVAFYTDRVEVEVS
jgi:uncharacterized protein (DUF427 family)